MFPAEPEAWRGGSQRARRLATYCRRQVGRSRTATNLKRAERLRQAILKRAFEGKLVPQDPNDEPASKLLERIRHTKLQETDVNSLRSRTATPASKHRPQV